MNHHEASTVHRGADENTSHLVYFCSRFFLVFSPSNWIRVISSTTCTLVGAKRIELGFKLAVAIVAHAFDHLLKQLWRNLVAHCFHSGLKLQIHLFPRMIHVSQSLFAHRTSIFRFVQPFQAALVHGVPAFEHRTTLHRIKQSPETRSTVLLERILKARVIPDVFSDDAHSALVAMPRRFSRSNTTDTTAVAMKNLFSRSGIIRVTNCAAVRSKQNSAL